MESIEGFQSPTLSENRNVIPGLTVQQVADIIDFSRQEAMRLGIFEYAALAFFGQPHEYEGLPDAAVKLNKGKEPPKSFSAVYSTAANYLTLQSCPPPIYRTGFEENQVARSVVHANKQHIHVSAPESDRTVTYVQYIQGKELKERDFRVKAVALEQRFRPDYYQDVDMGGVGGVNGHVRMDFVARGDQLVPARLEVFRLIDFASGDEKNPFRRFNAEYRKDLQTGECIYKEALIDKRGQPGNSDWEQQTAHIKWIQHPNGRLVIAIGDEALIGSAQDQAGLEPAVDRVGLRFQNSKWDAEIMPIVGQHSFYRWWLGSKAPSKIKDAAAREYFTGATNLLQQNWASSDQTATVYTFSPPVEVPSFPTVPESRQIEDKHAQ
jgi:hypothetical protein